MIGSDAARRQILFGKTDQRFTFGDGIVIIKSDSNGHFGLGNRACGRAEGGVEMKKKMLGFVMLLCIAASPMAVMAQEIDIGAMAWDSGGIEEVHKGSDILSSFQIKIDGEWYQFPMKYEEFIEKGWQLDGLDSQSEMTPGNYGSVNVKKNTICASVTIMNFGMNTKPLSECYVAGIDLNETYLKDQMSFELPGGIVYDVSTMSQVEETYGAPSALYKTKEYGKLTYDLAGFYNRVEIFVDAAEKKVKRVAMICLTAPEDFEEDEINSEIPQVVAQYQTPQELGEDIASGTVRIDGSLYRIPAPVSAFLENGWKIVYDGNSEVIAGQDSGDGYYLMKNQQKLRICVKNYDDNATTVENCFVTEIYNQNFSTEILIELPREITFGMSSAQLEEILTGTEYEKEEGNTFLWYVIPCGEDSEDEVKICVNKKSDTVVKISIRREPQLEQLS